MFSDVLLIKPKLDAAAMSKMQKDLQGRFTKIAKMFAKGIGSALKGGGIAGIALGLVDKLLNPLKEVQEAIDRTLKSSDDIATNARQFNTTSGKLFKLVKLAQATGLDQDNLFQLINKFQNSVAEAQADPSKPSAVANFTGDKDTAQSFFDFIQALNGMERNQQLLVQQQVFGEKQILKMADFLQSIGDPKALGEILKVSGLGKMDSANLTNSIDKLSNLNDLADTLKAGQEARDIVKKADVINRGMVVAEANSAQIQLDRENQNIANYKNLAAISDSVNKIMAFVEQGTALVGNLVSKVLPFIDKVTDFMSKLLKSPLMKGVRGLFGGGE